MLPEDDWQGKVLKETKDKLKKRKRLKDPTNLLVGNIEKVMTLKLNSIAEKTLESDSLEN